MKRLFLVFASFVMLGCASDDLTPEEGAQVFCDGDREREIRCGRTPDADFIAECIPDIRADFEIIRPDAFDAVAACNESRACDEGDDRCFSAMGLGISASAASAAFRTACEERRMVCIGEESAFSDDWCFAGILRDSVISAARACLDRGCTEITECFRAAVNR